MCKNTREAAQQEKTFLATSTNSCYLCASLCSEMEDRGETPDESEMGIFGAIGLEHCPT